MASFGFDDDEEGINVEQEYEGGLVIDEEDRIDYTPSYRDRETHGGGIAWEKKDLYDQSLEDRLMDEVKKKLGDYDFPLVKAARIEDAIKKYEMELKQSNPALIISATMFLELYENREGLTQKNFKAFEKHKYWRETIKKLDLIRYIRFLNTLGMEVNPEM